MDPPLLPCQPMETVPSASPPGPLPSAGPADAIPTLTQLRVLLPYWLGSLYECPSLPLQHPLVVLSGVGESAVGDRVSRWSVLGAVLKSHGTRDMAVATHLVQAVTLLAESITASSSGWSSTEKAACVRSGVLEALLALWGSVLPQPQPVNPPSPPQSLEQLQALADDGFRRMLLQCCIQALIAVVPALGAPVTAPSSPLLVPQADDSLLHSPRTSAPAAALPAPLLDWCGRVCGVALQCLANSSATSPPAIPSGAPSSPQASVLRPPVALAHLMLLPGAGLAQSWMRESACVSGGCLVLLTLLWGAIKATDKPGPHTQPYHQALPLVLAAMHKHSWHDGVQLHGFDALGCLLLPPPSAPHSGVVSVGSEASAVVAAVLRVAPLLLPSPYYCARMCTLLQAMLPQILHSDDEDVDESAMQLSLSESEHSLTDPLQHHDRQQLLATAVQAIFQALRAHPKSLELCRAGWGVLGVVLPQCPQCPVSPLQGVKQMCSAMARLVVLALVAFPRQSDVVDACLHTFASALGQWGVAALRGLGVPVLSAVRQALGPSLPHPDKDKDKEPLYMTAVLALTALLLRGDGALLRYVCGLRSNGQKGQGAGLWPAHVLALALTSPSTPHMLLPDVCQALGVLCRAKDVGLLVLEAGACEAVAALLLKTHTQLQDLLAEPSQQHDQTENENDVGALRGLCVCASECLRALFSVDGDVSTSRLHDRHLAHAFPLALPYLNTPTATPPSSPPLTPSSSSPSSRLIITSAPRRLPLSPAPSAPLARVPISRPPPRVLSSTGLDPLLEALLARPTTAARQRQQLLQLTRALQHEPHRRRCLFKSGAVRGVMGALEAHPHHLALQQAGLQALAALLHTPTEAMAVLQQEGQALATLLANGIAGLASPMPPHSTASLMCSQPGDTEADEPLHTAWGHEEEGGRHRRGRLGVGRAALEVVMALMAQQEEEARQQLVRGGVGRTVQHTMTHFHHQRHHSSQDKEEEEAKVLELLQRVSMLLSPPVSSGLVVVLDEEEEEGGEEDWSGLQTLLKASTQVLDLMEQCKQHTATGGHSRRRARWDLRKRNKTRTTPA